MKLIALIIIFVVVGLAFVLKKGNAKTLPNDPVGKEAYQGLRTQALGVTPELLGNVETIGAHGVYGVIMETGFPEGKMTLVTFVTGDASIYLSSGGGVIGGFGHEAVREATLRFNRKADEFVSLCEKAAVYPGPEAGETIFYILTKEGIYAKRALEDDLGNERSPFSPLFIDGHGVITQLRLVSEKNDK